MQAQGVALGCNAPAFQAEKLIDHPLCRYRLFLQDVFRQKKAPLERF